MSDDPCLAIIRPPRYNMAASHLGQMLKHPEGEFVDYNAYEKLADRWQAQREYIAEVHKKVAALEAENERLRKAGDAMETAYLQLIRERLCGNFQRRFMLLSDIKDHVIEAWLAAKGVQP